MRYGGSFEGRAHTEGSTIRGDRYANLRLFPQPFSVCGWTWAFLLNFHRLWQIETFVAALAQDGLTECDQPGKNVHYLGTIQFHSRLHEARGQLAQLIAWLLSYSQSQSVRACATWMWSVLITGSTYQIVRQHLCSVGLGLCDVLQALASLQIWLKQRVGIVKLRPCWYLIMGDQQPSLRLRFKVWKKYCGIQSSRQLGVSFLSSWVLLVLLRCMFFAFRLLTGDSQPPPHRWLSMLVTVLRFL